MGNTLNQYRYEITDIANQNSSDSNLDLRLVDFWIQHKREHYFVNLYNRFNKTVPTIYYQTLPCVEVIDVDQSECCTIKTGCYIKRTKDKIPQFITLTDGELIDKVGPTYVTSIPFDIIPYRRAEYFGSGKFNKNRIAAFIYNDYIYLISEDNIHLKLIEYINIRGIFRDPIEAGRFKDCDDKPCFSAESTYPMEGRLWDYVKKDIISNELRVKLGSQEDNEGDNRDNLNDPIK